jgi:hypothetical protein
VHDAQLREQRLLVEEAQQSGKAGADSLTPAVLGCVRVHRGAPSLIHDPVERCQEAVLDVREKLIEEPS